jgi:3-methyladenine DNA glycosylase AlkD
VNYNQVFNVVLMLYCLKLLNIFIPEPLFCQRIIKSESKFYFYQNFLLMDFFIDNPETEHLYQEILRRIRLRQNVVLAESIKQRGISYKNNWGVSVTELKELASEFKTDHLLALKLWNKKWRETMILATMLDNPGEVSEEQMNFWTKSFENQEIAEQTVANLWVKTPYAFIRALEWCRGKKHLVRVTGILLIGRLALIDRKATNEMFEIYFDEFKTLAKDIALSEVLRRALVLIARRNAVLYKQVADFSDELKRQGSEAEIKLGKELSDDVLFCS